MLFKSYIGVTGFSCRQQVLNAMSLFPKRCSHQLAVGVLVSNKTAMNQPKTKDPGIFPLIRDIPHIPVRGHNVMNMLHYCPGDFYDFGFKMIEILCSDAGVGYALPCDGMTTFDGFQLNACWPDPRQLVGRFYGELVGKTTLILQIGQDALDQVDNDPAKLVAKLHHYLDLIDGILIDPSGGEGQEFDLTVMDRYLDTLYAASLGINIGIAGGLGSSDSLNRLLLPLACKYPDLSIDAQKKLQTDGVLDNVKVDYFVHRALRIFSN